MNVTNVLIEGVAIKHFDGSLWIHFAQNITVRNVTLFNRNVPEETGNIEVGGMGSHGTLCVLCAILKHAVFKLILLMVAVCRSALRECIYLRCTLIHMLR